MAHLYPRLATRCVPRRFTIVKHNCCQPKGPRFETCLGSQISPTSSSSALSVNSPKPRFGGNGQYRGNWALLEESGGGGKKGGIGSLLSGGGQSLRVSELACPFG